MALEPGKQLWPYEILEPIGSGGMGEVYRARDTRLNRSVAVKVLPAVVADQKEAKQRFEREAKAIAALNHPHICVLHDVGHHEGIDFLIMEHLAGEYAGRSVEESPLPIDQALRYGIEIADALDRSQSFSIDLLRSRGRVGGIGSSGSGQYRRLK